ncbi:OB-fold nucleic acid binding domain-containing protein [Geomonas nitrogeniifigens]|uniref:OB-fold nucleic acid binding domain-containing protein n=1 Tax=Geomonas diazotrophica TaxID=2843197 RepID=A0ABX8JFZ7_9BACT|nr:OB-fold nucleic acid binding domain-containing protein [Geomonas nitrogeniifigens]QWV96494.1 OB-fold nucleic acid binding domain-containing protein [Geomonas nitrogeniifigens]
MIKRATVISAFLVAVIPATLVFADGLAGGGGGVMSTTDGAAGKVVETATAGEYTYVNLEKDGKTAWVACPVTKVNVGQQLAFTGCTPMMNFESKALNKTFGIIMFCGMPLSQAETELLSKKSTGSSGLVPEAKEKIIVEMVKAPNAYSIADLYQKSEELDKKTVVVTGKVMKVSQRIMGWNWLHLQDGTGTPLQKNNDLVVTTKELPKVGDVVTVSGTFARNRDFGSGYKYAVILESASLQK